MSLFIEQKIQVTEFCEKGYQRINLVTYSLVQRFCHFKVLLNIQERNKTYSRVQYANIRFKNGSWVRVRSENTNVGR